MLAGHGDVKLPPAHCSDFDFVGMVLSVQFRVAAALMLIDACAAAAACLLNVGTDGLSPANVGSILEPAPALFRVIKVPERPVVAAFLRDVSLCCLLCSGLRPLRCSGMRLSQHESVDANAGLHVLATNALLCWQVVQVLQSA